jgi:hypothetical protein
MAVIYSNENCNLTLFYYFFYDLVLAVLYLPLLSQAPTIYTSTGYGHKDQWDFGNSSRSMHFNKPKFLPDVISVGTTKCSTEIPRHNW